MCKLPLQSLAAAALTLAAAGCAVQSAGQKTAALQPLQGTWRIAATTNLTGPLAPFAGSVDTVHDSILSLPATPPLLKQIELTPTDSKDIQNITLKPLPGQTGWTLSGITTTGDNLWILNIAAPGQAPAPTDFLPRDNAGDVVYLRKE